MNYIDFCLAIPRLMAACGGRITSWGRSPTGNLEVGGVSDSYHLLLMAVDWFWSNEELEKTTMRHVSKDGKVVEVNGYDRMKKLAPKEGLEVIEYYSDNGKRVHLEPKG